MAQVIEFYVPPSFERKPKWIPEELRGRIIEFPRSVKKVELPLNWSVQDCCGDFLGIKSFAVLTQFGSAAPRDFQAS